MMMGNDRSNEVEVIPGTDIVLYTNGRSEALGGEKVVLVPEPSDDPSDPLVRPCNTVSQWLPANKQQLERDMEIDSHHQSSSIRLHRRSHSTVHRAVDADLHPRVSQNTPASESGNESLNL